MSISEQVRELREVAEMYEGLDGGKILSEAADTTESLSAKLQAANMERSAGDCNGWIPCKERLPEIGKLVILSLKNLDICIGYRENDSISRMTAYLTEKGCRIEFGYVLAWQPLPEPYHEP